jgi:hypothetical protein
LPACKSNICNGLAFVVTAKVLQSDCDGDDEEELQRDEGGGSFAAEEDGDDGSNGLGRRRRRDWPPAMAGALDETADGDEEFVPRSIDGHPSSNELER